MYSVLEILRTGVIVQNVISSQNMTRSQLCILPLQKKLQAACEMQAIIEAILLADKDSNYHISEKELDEMMLRLRVFAGRSSSISEDEIRASFKHAMTSQGASLGRIHSHLQAQQQAEVAAAAAADEAAADDYMFVSSHPKSR